MTKFFTRGSHHLNLTIFCLVQNLFFRGIRTISLNSQIVVLFKNPCDSQQVSFFSRLQNTPKKLKQGAYKWDLFAILSKKNKAKMLVNILLKRFAFTLKASSVK